MSTESFDNLLRSVRREVDHVLADVPQSLLEARRLVTREMQFEPRPEELQAIVRIASFMSTSVACYELPRQMLALRVIAERELNGYWGARRLCPASLARAGRRSAELLQANEYAENDLLADAEVMRAMAAEERTFLLDLRDVLALPKQKLEATATLAPRLELFAKQASSGNIDETFPDLSEDEIEMFNQAVHLDEQAAGGPARVCLDAIALRTIFEEYYEVWESSGYVEDAELLDQLRRSIRERLAETDIAYTVLNERLQRQQDEAISANLAEFGAEIRKVKSKLFEAYSRTRPLLRDAQAVEVVFDGSQRTVSDILADAEASDLAAAPTKKVREELYLDALTSLRHDRAANRDLSMHPIAVRKRARKRRLWLMASGVVVLGLFAVGVHLLLPKSIPEPVDISLKEFQQALSVIEAKPIGSMLYVRVTDWDSINVEKTRFRTAEIGALAQTKGLTMAYVVNDRGQQLAEWHANGGVLVKSQIPTREQTVAPIATRNNTAPITIRR